uniref:Uncharacterized protein n=1 Tax=viral metagenome TaxID=1070528 RepID=A0A6C0IGB0_9ZZZZ
MPRCSEKTSKGLRCKANGLEHNGKIICTIHLKDYEDMPDLIPVTISSSVTPQDDFDNVIAEMMSIVGTDDIARIYISDLPKIHKCTLYDHGDANWNFVVSDTLDHILSSRLAGMPEDRATWCNKDAQLNTLMNKLTEIHKSMLKPINPDRPETLEKAYECIDELQKKIGEMKEKNKHYAIKNLWNSGCEDMCYHLGYCSDVMGDCWEPVYEKDGLEGLKANLRAESKHHHNGKACDDCKKWIEFLHD